MRRGRPLAGSFYARDSLAVAPDLLGKLIVRDDPVLGRVAARIVEVEAYRGHDDPGSHGFRGPTPRTSTMFGPPGRLYVYFTYGMHWCANVVTGSAGEANAVLLRGAEPVAGLAVMRDRRVTARRDRHLCAGPARLTRALAITGADDGTDLRRGELRVLDDGAGAPAEVEWTTRIGLAPGRGDDRAWRCVVAGSRFASR